MTQQQLQAALETPQALRLQDLAGDGLAIGHVFGKRIIVSPIEPRTKLDDLERAGVLYAPQETKEKYTPTPSTGIVLRVGASVSPGIYEHDAVIFNRHAASHHVINGNKIAVISEEDVYCTLVAAGPERAL